MTADSEMPKHLQMKTLLHRYMEARCEYIEMVGNMWYSLMQEHSVQVEEERHSAALKVKVEMIRTLEKNAVSARCTDVSLTTFYLIKYIYNGSNYFDYSAKFSRFLKKGKSIMSNFMFLMKHGEGAQDIQETNWRVPFIEAGHDEETWLTVPDCKEIKWDIWWDPLLYKEFAPRSLHIMELMYQLSSEQGGEKDRYMQSFMEGIDGRRLLCAELATILFKGSLVASMPPGEWVAYRKRFGGVRDELEGLVCSTRDDWAQKKRDRLNKVSAVLMAKHPRLGAGSMLFLIDQEVLVSFLVEPMVYDYFWD